MWLTVLHALQWPLAIVCGYAFSRIARHHGWSVWLAYLATLAAGLTIGITCSAFASAGQHPWSGFLIWAAWAGFGTFHGWRGERPPHTLTTLGLSGPHK